MAETPDQIRLRLLALARQREAEASLAANPPVPPPELLGQGMISQAQIDEFNARKAELIKRQEAQKARQTPLGPEGIVPQIGEAGRSAAEGVMGILDAPFVVGSKLGNAALTASGQEPAPVSAPFSGLFNKILPPNENFPTTRQWGNVAGPAIVESLFPPLAGVMPEVGLMRNAVRPAMTTASTVAGQDVGQAFGQAYGGDEGGNLGFELGSIFSPFAPAVARSGVESFVRKNYTDANSVQNLKDAKLAMQPGNYEQGPNGMEWVPPAPGEPQRAPVSLGQVGNKAAGLVEDVTVRDPLAGGPAYRAREAQYGALDAGKRDVANIQRGSPPTGEVSPQAVGGNARNAAEQANAAAKGAQDAALNPIYDAYGRDNPVQQTTQLDQMETVRRGSQPQYRAPVQQEISNTNQSRFDTQGPLGAKVVDPAAEAQLQFDLARARANEMNAPSRAVAEHWQGVARDLQDQIDANRGQTLQEMIESRSKLGRRVEGQQPLDQQQTIATKEAMTRAMKDATGRVGVPGEAFDTANAEAARLYDQRDIFKTLADAKRKGAYNQLGDTDTLRALQEHAPDALSKIMADALELKTRGRNAGGQIPDPLAENPLQSANNWANLSEQQKTLMAGPPGTPSRERMEAIARTEARDAVRPTRAKPSGGSSISALGNAGTTGLFGSVLGLLGGGGFGAGVGGLLGAAAPSAASWMTGKAFTNPNFVESVVNRGGNLGPNDISRLLAGAVGGTQGPRR